MPVGQYTNRPYSSFRATKMTAPKSLTTSSPSTTSTPKPMTPSERTQTHRCSFKSTSSTTSFSQLNNYNGNNNVHINNSHSVVALKPLTPKLCRKIDSFAVKRQPCQLHTRSPATSSQTSDESIVLKYDIPLSTQVSQKRSYNTVKVPKTDKKPPVKKPNAQVLANKSTNQQIKKKYKEDELKKASFSSKFPQGLPFEDEFYYNRPRSYSQTSSNFSFNHHTSISAHDNFKNMKNKYFEVQKENRYIDEDDEFTRKPSNDSLYVDFSKVIGGGNNEDDDYNNNIHHNYHQNNDFYYEMTKTNQEKRKTTTTTKTTFDLTTFNSQRQQVLQRKGQQQQDSYVAVSSWIPKCQDTDDSGILDSTTSEYKLVSFFL